MAQLSDRGGWREAVDRGMAWLPARLRRGSAVVPVVRLSGVIGAVTPLRPGMTLAGIAKTLEKAFATKNARAVALVINSPGGSPVQSRQIYLRIRQLAREKNLQVMVFVEDVAASGGYMIACAGDEIYCDPSSDPRIDRRGRRLLRHDRTDQEDRRRAQALYRGRAQGDARSVPPRGPRRCRAAEKPSSAQDPRDLHRPRASEPRRASLGADGLPLFTGEYWAGETAVSLGLADGIGDLRSTLRARFGEKVATPVIAPASGMLSGLFGRRAPGAGSLGCRGTTYKGLKPDELISALETRAIWSRFGF